jgi:hypothetical protein
VLIIDFLIIKIRMRRIKTEPPAMNKMCKMGNGNMEMSPLSISPTTTVKNTPPWKSGADLKSSSSSAADIAAGQLSFTRQRLVFEDNNESEPATPSLNCSDKNNNKEETPGNLMAPTNTKEEECNRFSI